MLKNELQNNDLQQKYRIKRNGFTPFTSFLFAFSLMLLFYCNIFSPLTVLALASSSNVPNKQQFTHQNVIQTKRNQNNGKVPGISRTLAAQKSNLERTRGSASSSISSLFATPQSQDTTLSSSRIPSGKTSYNPFQKLRAIKDSLRKNESSSTKLSAHTTVMSDESDKIENIPDKDSWWKYGEYNTPLMSRLTYHYVTPLLNKVNDKDNPQILDTSDAFLLPDEKRTDATVKSLTTAYQHQKQKALEKAMRHNSRKKESSSITLAKALCKQQSSTLIFTGIIRLLNTCIQAFPAVLVSKLLKTIEAGNTAKTSKSLTIALSLIGVLSLKMLVENLYFHSVVKMSTRVRGSLSGLIFDKSLRVPSSTATAVSFSKKSSKKEKKYDKELGVGGVLNLMQNDASTLEYLALQVHTSWDGPLQIVVYSSLLYRYLGPCVFWGIGVLLTAIPVNSITLRILARLNEKEIEAKDSRTKKTTEALTQMKLLKMQTWEKFFSNQITTDRNKELDRHVTKGIVRALSVAFAAAVPSLVLVVTLAAYARSGRPLLASTIFTAISLFNQLRFPLFFYPMLIDSIANGKNSLKRISNYLDTQEVVKYVTHLPSYDENTEENSGGEITVQNGNFLWSAGKIMNVQNGDENDTIGINGNPTSTSVPALCDVNLQVSPGEVLAVVGTVGSGKSALIKALLGELSPVPRTIVDSTYQPNGSGGVSSFINPPQVVCKGPVSYSSQESWLPKGSIRDAIVFGRDYDENRYKSAIYDAGLDEDVMDDDENGSGTLSREVLTHNTDVGEGGSSLSGGQRARVALARALYGGGGDQPNGHGGIYLLDDPLAALDPSVRSTVFRRLMARFKRENAAVLFVTNDAQIPRECNRVVLMDREECSKIKDIGTYDQLLSRGYDLKNLAIATTDDNDNNTESTKEESVEKRNNEKDLVKMVSIQPIEVLSSGKKLSKTVRADSIHENDRHNSHWTNSTEGETGSTSCHADPDSNIPCDNWLEKPKTIDPIDEEYEEDEQPISTNSVITETPLNDNSVFEGSKTESNESVKSIPKKSKTSRKLASIDDTMGTGAVPRETYVSYFRTVGKPILLSGMLGSFVVVNLAQLYQQFIVSKWTEVGRNGAMSMALQTNYLSSLAKAACVVSVFLFLRSYFTMQVGVLASRNIHKNMLKSIFSAPLSFFDSTPSGQLLSRFGKELDTIDRSLPDGISSVLYCFTQILFSCIALAGAITPGLVVPLVAVSYLYSRVMGRFRPAARDMKRSESKSRAPIYTHFGEALRGAETIRSIPSGTASWSLQHKSLTDSNLSVFYVVKAFDRWLSVQLETLGNGVVLLCAIVSIYLSKLGRLKPGAAGWGLTQALSITGLLTWAVRCLTDLESQMMSVLRVSEITDIEASSDIIDGINVEKQKPKIPSELSKAGEALPSVRGKVKLPTTPKNNEALVKSGWPWTGSVEFKDVSMRYNSASPLVLQNVTVSVPGGTTLGVVGRTGSGKSSLLLTLFRLVEIAGGSILIDGVDIRSLSLQSLRNNLSIIPQDPVLFSGTVLYNLDATGQTTEEEAWKALRTASEELANKFESENGLNSRISEGGKNLSSGQRQLICLARALLRKSKILVLDEATASVDLTTDAQVQDIIKKEFVEKKVTVITVAHRLQTIIGNDQICVLGDGKVLETGTPQELLKKRDGEFRRLVEADKKSKQKADVVLN